MAARQVAGCSQEWLETALRRIVDQEAKLLRKFSSACIIISVLMLGGFGCAKEEAVEIKIGVMTPLTGDVPSWGEMQRRASDMALEAINNAGGVRGSQSLLPC